MKSFWLKEINTMSCSAVGMYVSPQIQIQPQNIKSWIKRNEKNLLGFFKGTAISLHANNFYTGASIVDQRTITCLMESETF